MKTINKTSEFFIALCKQKETVHSFVTLGVMDDENIPTLLCAYGKVFDNDYCDQSSTSNFYNEVLFSHVPGSIINERVFTTDKKKAEEWVNYKAYSINFEQYKEFLLYIKELNSKQNKPLKAYCPIELDNNNLSFEWIKLSDYDNDNNNTNNLPSTKPDCNLQFSIRNTCRSTAIDFTKKATKLDSIGEGISSSNFFRKPPLTTFIKDGKIDDKQFLTLPLPPKTYTSISAEIKVILTRLYKRLDRLILIAPNNPLTAEKFKAIKGLYQSLVRDEKATMSEIYKEINDWANQNDKLISTHRRKFQFFFKTATKELVDDVLQVYKKFSKCSPSMTEKSDRGFIKTPICTESYTQ